MKKNMVKYYLCLVFLFVEFTAFCQDFPSEDEDGDLQGDDAAPVPINGKIIWLGIAAILFSLYKFRNYRSVQTDKS